MPDIAQLLGSKLIGALWWIIPLIVLVQALRSPWFKGHVREWIVHLSARLLLPSNRYASFRNVTLPTPDGTTQIDHIFVSQFGVFVVETKNMKGWIFGSERQAQWTQKNLEAVLQISEPAETELQARQGAGGGAGRFCRLCSFGRRFRWRFDIQNDNASQRNRWHRICSLHQIFLDVGFLAI